MFETSHFQYKLLDHIIDIKFFYQYKFYQFKTISIKKRTFFTLTFELICKNLPNFYGHFKYFLNYKKSPKLRHFN
jgi:hypothetical protein